MAPNKKARILLLGKLPPPYMGPAVATKILLGSSLTERYEVLHVDTNVHESLDTIGSWSLAKVYKNAAIYSRYAAALVRARPEVVLVPISQSTMGFLKDSVFILLAWVLGSKPLVQLRGSNLRNWLASASGPTRAYVRSALSASSGVIVLGDNLRHLFEEYFGADRIFVVPNGADYQLPVPEPPGRAPHKGAMTVLYLANLQPSKGIEDVLEAVALLKTQGVSGFAVDVVGAWRDAATEAACRALVGEHGLPVRFHGPAYDADKLAFMAQADVFVFTPREPEGHPWVIVEALASGLPIISTDQGAIRESVRDGVNGYLVAPRNPREIAERLRLLLERPELRATMAAASRRLYEENFTEEKMVERLSGAIDQLIGTGTRTRRLSGRVQGAHAWTS